MMREGLAGRWGFEAGAGSALGVAERQMRHRSADLPSPEQQLVAALDMYAATSPGSEDQLVRTTCASVHPPPSP